MKTYTLPAHQAKLMHSLPPRLNNFGIVGPRLQSSPVALAIATTKRTENVGKCSRSLANSFHPNTSNVFFNHASSLSQQGFALTIALSFSLPFTSFGLSVRPRATFNATAAMSFNTWDKLSKAQRDYPKPKFATDVVNKALKKQPNNPYLLVRSRFGGGFEFDLILG